VGQESQREKVKKEIEAREASISFLLGVRRRPETPFAPQQFVPAVNRGTPLLISNPTDLVSTLIEDFGLRLSKPEHQEKAPNQPSEDWTRVHERLEAPSSTNQKTKERWRPSFLDLSDIKSNRSPLLFSLIID